MKKGMIALLSVLALAFAFAGCSEDGSFTKVGTGSENTVVEDTVTVDDSIEGYVNGLSISDELGVPPVRPE